MFNLNLYPKEKEILCQSAVPVDLELLGEFKEFILQMKKFVKENNNSLGLSANQVWPYHEYPAPKVFVMVVTDNRDVQEFINPIVQFSGPTIKHIEGCLSRPGKLYHAKRSKNCTIHYYDLEGKEHIEKYGGAYAQIIGHEMQHLQGKLLKREAKVKQ